MDLKPEEIYKKEVLYKEEGVFGRKLGTVTITEPEKMVGLLKEFWAENDIQEIILVSTNIGTIRTYTKQYK
jgi:hypothetical protein